MNKTVVVSHNPNNGNTLISWNDGVRERNKTLFDETSISNFITSLKPDEIKYKKHRREGVKKSFDVTEAVVSKAKAIQLDAEEDDFGCLVLDAKYKRIWCSDRLIPANRLVYFAYNPSVSQEYLVRHTCDNPYCVKEDHLVHGTYKNNTDDCIIRKIDNYYNKGSIIERFAFQRNLPESCELLVDTNEHHVEMVKRLNIEIFGVDAYETILEMSKIEKQVTKEVKSDFKFVAQGSAKRMSEEILDSLRIKRYYDSYDFDC